MGTDLAFSSPPQLWQFCAVNIQMKTKSRSAQSVLRLNQQNAHSVVVLTETGNRLMAQGEFKQAQECFQSALELLLAGNNAQDKRTAIAHYNLARSLAALERFEDALNHYEAAIEIRPRFPEALNNLGMLRNDFGQFDQAIEHFKIVISVEPLFASAHYGLGVAYQNLNDTTTAAICYQKAIMLKPDFFASWVNLGLICYQIGSPDVAVHCYNEAIGLSPGNAELYFQLGLAYMALTNFADASRAFTKALEFEPWYKEAKDALEEAMFYALAGTPAPAAEDQKTA